MRTLFKVVAFLSLPLLSACAVAPSPALQARQAEFNQSIPTCSSESECKTKWEAAQIWVVNNSSYKIQTATDVLIQTFNPTGGDPRIGARAIKEPTGGGNYRIVVTVFCDNIFGCQPNSWDAAISFNRYVNSFSQ